MGERGFDLGDYNTVPERIAEFREKYPEGSLRPLDPTRPYSVEKIGEQWFVVYAAVAMRTPDDPAPGSGIAWEPVPGKTPYTRDSELQNAETSAWGRAIVAVGAADTKKGIATREEVTNRREAVHSPPPPRPDPVDLGWASAEEAKEFHRSITARWKALGRDKEAEIKAWMRENNLPWPLSRDQGAVVDLHTEDVENAAEESARGAGDQA